MNRFLVIIILALVGTLIILSIFILAYNKTVGKYRNISKEMWKNISDIIQSSMFFISFRRRSNTNFLVYLILAIVVIILGIILYNYYGNVIRDSIIKILNIK